MEENTVKSYRSIRFHFKGNESQLRLLSFLSHIAKNIYNYALFILMDDYDTTGKLMSKYDLDSICRQNDNFHIINTSTAEMTVFRAYDNFKSYLSLTRKDEKTGRPRFLPKNGETTITTSSFNTIEIKGKTYVKMPLSNDMRTGRVFSRCYGDPLIDEWLNRLDRKDTEKFYLPVPKVIKDKNIKTVTIRKRNSQYEVIYSYEMEEKPVREPDFTRAAAVDLGVNNLMAMVLYDNSSFVIDGKLLKSRQLYFGNKFDYLQSKNKDRKYTRRMYRLLFRFQNFMSDYLRKSVSSLFHKAEEHKANTIIIGMNKNFKKGGIKNEALKGKKKRRINRTFMSFPFSRLISMIQCTAKKKGIAVVTTEESYTSKASFYDGDMPEKGVEFSGTRFTRSLYRTKDKRIVNADINAALNIYRKCSPEAERLRCMGITCPRRLQVMNP